MLQTTDHFIRFERVSSVEQTERGLLAQVHLEQLRIDLVRDDVVRIKLSRGGIFDEAPTHAVCVDPLGERVDVLELTFDRVIDSLVRAEAPAAPIHHIEGVVLAQQRREPVETEPVVRRAMDQQECGAPAYR